MWRKRAKINTRSRESWSAAPGESMTAAVLSQAVLSQAVLAQVNSPILP
ncbi:hypothetical protein [Prochlorothrix hollandica]